MMTIDGIFAQLNGLIERREWDEVEPFLTGCMENASELKNYGIYITIGNELLDFYRETGQFENCLLYTSSPTYSAPTLLTWARKA